MLVVYRFPALVLITLAKKSNNGVSHQTHYRRGYHHE